MSDPITFALTAVVVEYLVKGLTDYFKEALKDVGESKPPSKKKSYEVPYEITPIFGKFVTRNSGFQAELNELRDVVQDYATRADVARPLNILLAAEPGNGKSFLVKQLAKKISKSSDVEVEFEEFHVAAFRSVDDLIGVFQRVQSSNLNGRLPFVLFGEVDGRVNGRHIFANLLAPMWDGRFHVGKESFALGKAVFLFAASNLVPSPTILSVLGAEAQEKKDLISYDGYAVKWREQAIKRIEEPDDKEDAIEKSKDFTDRIDIWVCIPPVHPAISEGDAALEKIDIACLLILKHFKNIKRIDASAAWVLSTMLSQTSSRRGAERSVFLFSCPQWQHIRVRSSASARPCNLW